MTVRKKAKKSVKKSGNPSAKPSGVKQPHGGMLVPGAGGGPQPGSGRPPSAVKALAAAKLPRHVDTLDSIAQGMTYITLRERCPKCGHEAVSSDTALPVTPRPGEQVRAVEALAKLADAKEVVITSANAVAFFECVHKAIVEIHGEPAAEAVKQRALKLMEKA
jgi:hypothetical protein